MSRRIGLILSILIAACSSIDDSGDGVPSALVATQTSPIEATVGASVQVSVRLLDANQRGIAGVTINFAAPAGSIQSATVATGSDGTASVAWLLPATPGIITLTASADGVDPLVITAKVASAIGATIALASGDPVADAEGFATDSVITVVAIDAYDRPIMGQAVSFVPDGASGTTSAPSSVTDAGGKATIIWRITNIDALQRLIITTAGVPPLSVTAVPLRSPTPREVAVSRWRSHACRIGPQGNASCWGANTLGALGVGDKSPHDGPVAVAGGRQYTAIAIGGVSAGTARTCALATIGTTWCWGPGPDGGGSDSPALLVDVPRLRVLTMGDAHLCGLDSDGFAWCWGTNASGQVGVGDLNPRATPSRISPTIRFQDISAGQDYTCGLARTGAVYCWGANGFGQVGDGTTMARVLPERVKAGQLRFTTLDAGSSHTCAIAVGGGLYCWGSNGNGQILGDGGFGGATTSPLRTQPAATFTRVYGGFRGTCGVRSDGAASCWGSNMSYQLADSLASQSKLAGPMAGGFTFREIRLSQVNSCGITTSGETRCWGVNENGLMGRPNITGFTTPQPVAGGHTFSQIATGFFHSCGLEADGSTWCWGRNFLSALGTPGVASSPYPIPVSLAPPFKAISAAGYTTCGIDMVGAIWCWGQGSGGQIGDGAFSGRDVPTRSILPVGMVGLSLGYYTACAITGAGVPWCWGRDGSESPTALPAPVTVAEPITAISVGANLAMARGQSGAAYTWAQRFGNANTQASVVPLPSPVSTVAAGSSIGCVVTTGGNGYCNEVYNPTFAPRLAGMSLEHFVPTAPVRCLFLSESSNGCWGPSDPIPSGPALSFAQVGSSLFDYRCAITGEGKAYCWGNNQDGQLGTGEYASRFVVPTLIP